MTPKGAELKLFVSIIRLSEFRGFLCRLVSYFGNVFVELFFSCRAMPDGFAVFVMCLLRIQFTIMSYSGGILFGLFPVILLLLLASQQPGCPQFTICELELRAAVVNKLWCHLLCDPPLMEILQQKLLFRAELPPPFWISFSEIGERVIRVHV